MPITRKATEAATRHRIHGKHTRWAIEMRAAGWMVISPETMKAPDGVWLDAIAAELRERGWLVAAPKDLVREVVGRWDAARATIPDEIVQRSLARTLRVMGWTVSAPASLLSQEPQAWSAGHAADVLRAAGWEVTGPDEIPTEG